MWILDEASYRIDKTNFHSRDEAEQKAGEAARILGRPISVYQLIRGELIFDFKVLPDGTVSKDDPTAHPVLEEKIKQPTDAPILGNVLDEVAAELERAGRPDLAAAVDAESHKVSVKPAVKPGKENVGAAKLAAALKNPYRANR